MTSVEPTRRLVCTRCDATVEVCAFCEREDCAADVICQRCLRNQLLQTRIPSMHTR